MVANFTYKHCGGSYSNETNKVLSKTIFKYEYPIYGIITVPIQIDIKLEYGYKIYAGPMKTDHGCEASFRPYFYPSIRVEGGLDLKLVRGGVYAQGYIANAELVLMA